MWGCVCEYVRTYIYVCIHSHTRMHACMHVLCSALLKCGSHGELVPIKQRAVISRSVSMTMSLNDPSSQRPR